MRNLFVWYGLYENLPFGRNRNKQQNLAHFDNNDSCIFDTFDKISLSIGYILYFTNCGNQSINQSFISPNNLLENR